MIIIKTFLKLNNIDFFYLIIKYLIYATVPIILMGYIINIFIPEIGMLPFMIFLIFWTYISYNYTITNNSTLEFNKNEIVINYKKEIIKLNKSIIQNIEIDTFSNNLFTLTINTTSKNFFFEVPYFYFQNPKKIKLELINCKDWSSYLEIK